MFQGSGWIPDLPDPRDYGPGSAWPYQIDFSCGPAWDEDGYGWLPYDYVHAGLTSDWWALVRAGYLDLAGFGARAAAQRDTS